MLVYNAISWIYIQFSGNTIAVFLSLVWNVFGHSLISSKQREDTRTGERGHQDRLSLVFSSGSHGSPCVRMYEPRITPESPRVISVIITIITLRLQEISTMASEEKPGLCSMRTTHHAYREQQTSCMMYSPK
ncbi:hypothetical protein GOODEAATRI_013286 [Goodea atripinnis]|uniref:Uncharacterized protein n=1 Tax=Goodea atripinnis TaxID=208336 RepID=A0ABV0N0Z2_9TELE